MIEWCEVEEKIIIMESRLVPIPRSFLNRHDIKINSLADQSGNLGKPGFPDHLSGQGDAYPKEPLNSLIRPIIIKDEVLRTPPLSARVRLGLAD